MNSLLNKFVFYCFCFFCFFSYIFASNSRAMFGGDCTDSKAACASIVSGSPFYSNGLYPMSYVNMVIAQVRGLAIINVDVTDWDLTVFYAAFEVVSTKNHTISIDNNVYMLESNGTPDFSQNVNFFIQNDTIKDIRSDYYLLFKDGGSVIQTKGDFINMGYTLIVEGAKFVYTPSSLYSGFYSEILQVGEVGGANAQFTLNNNYFAFSELYIANATFSLSNVSYVLIAGVDKTIKMSGDVILELNNINIENADFGGKLQINVVGDNNIITALNTNVMWRDFGFYIEGEGPSMNVTCSATCTGNGFDISNTELHFNTIYLENVTLFTIDMDQSSRYNVEHYELVNSNLVFYSDDSRYESALSASRTHNYTGTIKVDNNSSFTLNASNLSIVDFHGTNIIAEGDVIMNFTENTSVNFYDTISIEASKNFDINFVDATGIFDSLTLLSGEEYINLTGDSDVEIRQTIKGDAGSTLIFHVANNSLLYFIDTAVIGGDVEVLINQQVDIDGTEQSLIRFDLTNTFLDDQLVYKYEFAVKIRSNNFSVHNLTGNQIVVIQIKNNGSAGAFPQDEEIAVINKLNNSESSGDVGNIGGSSFHSVLIDTGGGASLFDYVTIGSTEYAEFAVGLLSFIKAEDKYGEDDGLLTLTTTENMNGYGIAVVFDNIVLSTTDTENYRVTLFNLVMNNSRTVEQLGQTLNSLGANMTLNNVLYSSNILQLNDKKNMNALVDDERFTTYAEIGNLSNNNFVGNYLLFGGSFVLAQNSFFGLGVSGFYSPYTSNTIYDLQEQSGNIGASVFTAARISKRLLLTLDASVMHSTINGMAMESLSPENIREYGYSNNATNITLSLSFGSDFSQRILFSAFNIKSQIYGENISDLALNVTTPSYANTSVGYDARLFNNKTFVLELGIKYYFKEEQGAGIAGFINDPSAQQWVYQYIFLDSPWEINANVIYKIRANLELMSSLQKRGTYNSLNIYLMYKKVLSVDDDSSNNLEYNANKERYDDNTIYDENN